MTGSKTEHCRKNKNKHDMYAWIAKHRQIRSIDKLICFVRKSALILTRSNTDLALREPRIEPRLQLQQLSMLQQ